MPTSSTQRRNLIYYLLCSVVLALLTVSSASAQGDNFKIDSGTGGRNTLQGDIYLPGGRRLDRAIVVKLNTPRGQIWTTSSGNGSFAFRQLHGGRYSVTVDAGDAFEEATESVVINEPSAGSGRPGQTFSVQIYLRPKAGAPTGRPSVVSADVTPKEAIDLYDQAIVSARNGQRDKAIEQLKRAVSIHPSFVAALNGLGVQYLRLQEYEKAANAFAQAVKSQPDNSILHFNLGVTLFHLKKLAEAEVELSKVDEKHAASAPAHYYRGRAFVGLRRLADAEKEFNRVVELGGSEVAMAYRYLAGIYLESQESSKALDALNHYLALAPKSRETPQILELIDKLKTSRK